MIHPIPPIGYAVIGGMFVLGVTRFVQVIRHEIQVREFNRMLKQLDKYYAENPCEDDGYGYWSEDPTPGVAGVVNPPEGK